MNLLVCGGAGFIGSAFVRRRLSSSNDSIVVLDKLTYAGNRANLADVETDPALAARLRFVRGDIADEELVGELTRDADAIVNFAAESHVDRSILDASAFLRTGVIGVHVLLEAALTVSRDTSRQRPVRLVQVSTDEVYGSIEEGAWDERAPVMPRSPYAAAKAAGDLLCLAYQQTHGVDVVVTRGSNTYGPRQHVEKLMPLFITNAIDDQQLPLYGDGGQRRDWLFVDDHADAVAAVLDRGAAGSIFNIPGTGERTNREVAAALLEALGKPWDLVRSVPDRPGHDRRYAMTGGAITPLGWQPQVEFADGLARTVAWYRENEGWWRGLKDADWADYYDRQYADRLAASTSVGVT